MTLMSYTGSEDVPCDVCTGGNVKALKTCLTCLASYCETHIQPHRESAALRRHKLEQPIGNIHQRVCPQHLRLLEFFCRKDQRCVCSECVLTEHKGHELVRPDLESSEKKKEVKVTISKIKQGICKKEKQMVDTRAAVEKLQRDAANGVKEYEDAFRFLSSEVTNLIRDHEKNQVKKGGELMKQLEKEIEELKRKGTELAELSQVVDHIHFLQLSLGFIRGVFCSFSVQCLYGLGKVMGSSDCGASVGEERFTDLDFAVIFAESMEALIGELERLSDESECLSFKSERRPYSGVPGVVECQECTGSKQMAVNSCLTCLISFCETHIQSHKENEAFKGHRLVTPDVNLPQKICSKHHMLKEVFCTTDQESICFKCVLFEHKSHRTLTPEAGRSEKQEQVAETMQEIQKRMQMNEEKVKAIKTALPEFKTFVEEKKKEYEETFDFLLQSITRQKSEIMKSITEYEQREEEKAKDLITTLENETDELRMRDIQLEEITKMDDDIHFLQTFPAFHASLGERNTEDITINGNLFRDKLSKNLNYLKKLLDKLSNFKFEEKTDPELKTEVKNDEKYVIKHEKEQLRSCSTDCVEPKNEAKITSQGHKKIILVVMHHTPIPEYIVADSSRLVDQENVVLTVDCLFHETTGLLNCNLNNESSKKVCDFIPSFI
ncbi:TRI29 protein, partial [Polypterus senegalus]